jgi:hypothetical protein
MDLWQRLKHKNILPLYGLVSDLCGPGTFGMVSPWITNGNLTQYLLGSPSLSFPARLRIVGLFTFHGILRIANEILFSTA